MLSLPTDSKTFGLISRAAMSDSSVPEALPVPEYPAPVAAVKAGFTTFSFRYSRDEAYATFAVPVTLALDDADADGADAVADAEAGADEDDEDELLQAAAVRPRHAMPATTANRLAEVRKVSILRR
jgi:hypothetical protein